MSKNKVHFNEYRRALCGCQSGKNKSNVVPLSKEWRDVTCKRCQGAHWSASPDDVYRS